MDLPLNNFAVGRHPVLYTAAAAGVAAVAGVSVWAARRKRPSAEELEQLRRHALAATGRIIDGTLIGVDPSESEPSLVFYRYRVAGVTYECSQDVSVVEARVHNVRLDFPVQVRYARANPANSIVVDESWNGLWSADGERGRALPGGASARFASATFEDEEARS